MDMRNLSRRQLLQRTSGVVITFSLASAFRNAGVAAQEATPTIAPELPDGGATPSVEPGLVATPENQTHQDFEQRDIDGDLVDSFLEIDASGNVTLYTGKVELGTGIQTALTQIVVEELDVPFDHTVTIMGHTALTPDQGATVGSKSLQVAGPVLRQAAAEARLVLLTRASEQLGVPADDLHIEDGVVSILNDSSQSISIGELASEPFNREITGEAPEKDPAQHTVVGQSIQRVDIPAKLTGGETYVQDVRLDGMLHGRVIRPYLRTMTDGVGATIETVDDSEARAMPGVVDVVRNGNFLGVVAEKEEQAIRAAEAVKVTWKSGESLPPQTQIHDLLREMPVADDVELSRNGDAEGALHTADQTLEATYRFPIHAHAMMGPSCGVVDVQPDRVIAYSHSQNVFALKTTLADLLGRNEDEVHVIFREGAGCYGHSGFDDVVADAALLSEAVGYPVRVQWMRADEFAWEPKMPPMLVDTRAGLDADGDLVAWDYELWTPTHLNRANGHAASVLAGQLIDPPGEQYETRYVGGDRNAPNNYSFPNNRVLVHWVETPPLHSSALRGLGAVSNVTANECFLDEVATTAGIDPVEFRLRYQADPRAVDVINETASAAGWETRPSGPRAEATPAADGPLTGRGIAYARYETEFAYAAAIAEVEVNPESGEIKVTRVVVGHDCGLIVNPDGLINQIQGNTIQGVSRALKEEISWDDHSVTSLDWDGYQILTFPEVPVIESVLVNRPDEPSLGSGETTIGPVVAAVGNAIFDATGVRLRTLPFTPERMLEGLQSGAS